MRATSPLLWTAVLLLAPYAGCLDPGSGVPGNASETIIPDASGNRTAGSTGHAGGSSKADRPSQAPVDPGWPPIEDAVVRPGVKLYDRLTDQLSLTSTPGEDVHYFQCTANFVFSGPDNRTLFVGAASHCVASARLGETIPIANGRANATVVYCSWGAQTDLEDCPSEPGTHEGDDFALLEIPADERGKVHPAMLDAGGPTGLADPLSTGDPVQAYGNSDLRDARQPSAPDELKAMDWVVRNRSTWYTYAEMDPPALPGDSGGPVVGPDGGAVGLIRDLRGPSTTHGREHVANVGITNLPAALGAMEERTGLVVELKTWPTLDGTA